MAATNFSLNRSMVATLVAFFIPLVGGILFNRAWFGLIIGIVTGAAIWKVLGGKVDDLKG